MFGFSDSKNIFKSDSLGIQVLDTQNQHFKTSTISTDSYNNLWIGSQKNGIYIFRKETDSTRNLKYHIERLYQNNGLPYNQIQKLHIQKDTVWVITKNKGDNKIRL